MQPPEGGLAAPERAATGTATVVLRPLAEEICRRYRGEFADEQERYGDAGVAWCVHDNQHILNWACISLADGSEVLVEQLAWLASVLTKRGFPLERLARDVEIAADVTAEEGHADIAALLALAASHVA